MARIKSKVSIETSYPNLIVATETLIGKTKLVVTRQKEFQSRDEAFIKTLFGKFDLPTKMPMQLTKQILFQMNIRKVGSLQIKHR